MFYSWLSRKKKLWSIAFANFHGINTPTGHSQHNVKSLKSELGREAQNQPLQSRESWHQPTTGERGPMTFPHFTDKVTEI